MVLELWRDVVMKAVLERFSPVALKVLSDEKVQAMLTQALNLQADMRQNIEAQVKLVARTLELVTRDELTSLRGVVKNLEAEIARMKGELGKQQAVALAPVPVSVPVAVPVPVAAPVTVPAAVLKPRPAKPKPAAVAKKSTAARKPVAAKSAQSSRPRSLPRTRK